MPERKGWERIPGHDNAWMKPVDLEILARIPKLESKDANVIKQFANIFNPNIQRKLRALYDYNEGNDLESVRKANILNKELKLQLGEFFGTAQAIALLGYYAHRR